MRLVFIHGWAFDAAFWDKLCGALDDVAQTRIGLGFFGGPTAPFVPAEGDILIGHSLGFLWGLAQSAHWSGAVALNSFARFTGGEGEAVAPSALRATKVKFARDPQKTLSNFYRNLGCAEQDRPNSEMADSASLSGGLSFLETAICRPLPRALVLAARNDGLVPPAASQYLAAALDAPLHWHETGGHLLPRTDPIWCAGRIRAFAA